MPRETGKNISETNEAKKIMNGKTKIPKQDEPTMPAFGSKPYHIPEYWEGIDERSYAFGQLINKLEESISKEVRINKDQIMKPITNLTKKDIQLILAYEYHMKKRVSEPVTNKIDKHVIHVNKTLETNFWKQSLGITSLLSLTIIGLFCAIFGTIKFFIPSIILGVGFLSLSTIGLLVIAKKAKRK
jgi:hypothetical protein